jgi:hypothetical protein
MRPNLTTKQARTPDPNMAARTKLAFAILLIRGFSMRSAPVAFDRCDSACRLVIGYTGRGYDAEDEGDQQQNPQESQGPDFDRIIPAPKSPGVWVLLANETTMVSKN